VKLCECGCGQPAPMAVRTDTAKGYVKGQPLRFVHGHGLRGGGVRLPARPFQDWIEERIDHYERECEFGGERLPTSGAVQRVAFDLGVGIRQLNRYRRGVTAAKPNGHGTPSVDVPVETFDRDAVEEMLWHADVFLWELYSTEEAEGVAV
jgi:hypothetical protein